MYWVFIVDIGNKKVLIQPFFGPNQHNLFLRQHKFLLKYLLITASFLKTNNVTSRMKRCLYVCIYYAKGPHEWASKSTVITYGTVSEANPNLYLC